MTAQSAFTLIELLVVVTIIVVLLALLVPALDRAVYQAELAVDGANLRGIGSAVVAYASGHRRSYPKRLTNAGWSMNNLNDNGGAAPGTGRFAENLVPVLEPYLGIKMYIDPLCGGIDLSVGANSPQTLLWSNYFLFFGWQYTGESGMTRLGDAFTWTHDPGGGPVQLRFKILAGDRDTRWDAGGWTNAGHPDSLSTMAFAAYQDQPPPWLALPAVDDSTLSWWHAFVLTRGEIDCNYAFDDGSVRRFSGVDRDDPSMAEVPEFRNGAQYIEGRRVQVPAAP